MYVPCLVRACHVCTMSTACSRQLTLFECCSSDCQDADGYPGTTNKRVRLSPGPDEDQSLNSDADSELEPAGPGVDCESDEPISSSYHFPINQTNNITLKNPSGPTTSVINSSPAPAASSTVDQPLCGYINSPSDIASTPAFPPVQPTGIKFPITVISGKSRAFNPLWYAPYPWLEYSTQRDACYCYSCRLFGRGPSGKCEKTFTVVGFRDWKHATGKSGVLSKHDSSYAHRQSVVAWNQYKSSIQHKGSIADQLGTARTKQIEQNRHYIKTLAEIILFCSHQEIALRGHREGEESMNKGNYLEILNLIALHDPVINERLKNGPKHAKYTSPDIQNALIHIMGVMVQKSICLSVQKAGVYTILADETKDCSKKEQLAIVLRYVDVEEGKLFEHFLTYVEATSLDARSLSEFILNTLRKNGSVLLVRDMMVHLS